jgi:hypothetical protein
MGGMNHQPCRKYLRNSTKISRSLSFARAKFELANVALEDIILNELGLRNPQSVETMLNYLDESRGEIVSAKAGMLELKKQMDNESYVDLPPYRTIDLQALGHAMADEELVDIEAWNDVVKLGKSEGFYGVLAEFVVRADNLRALTDSLIGKTDGLAKLASACSVEEALESNTAESIKREFAMLYSEWNFVCSRFLASSLLSTEVWYRFNGLGSLLNNGMAAIRAA